MRNLTRTVQIGCQAFVTSWCVFSRGGLLRDLRRMRKKTRRSRYPSGYAANPSSHVAASPKTAAKLA
jgi:hypothetical protein